MSYSSAGTDTTPQALQLALFDSTLGTLNSATLSFGGTLVSNALVVNNSAALNLANVTVSLFGGIAATRVGGPVGIPASVDLLAPATAMGSRTFVILGPNASTSTGPFTVTVPAAANSFSISSANALLGLTGSGNFGYSFASSASASVPAQFASVSLAASSLSSATLSIVYDYSPGVVVQAPEPATGLLKVLGLGAVGILRRRRAVQA